MSEFVLSNGVKISDLCYGTSIIHLYRYGTVNFASKAKY